MTVCEYCAGSKDDGQHPLYVILAESKIGHDHVGLTCNPILCAKEINSPRTATVKPPKWAKQGKGTWDILLAIGPFFGKPDALLARDLRDAWKTFTKKFAVLSWLLDQLKLAERVKWFSDKPDVVRERWKSESA